MLLFCDFSVGLIFNLLRQIVFEFINSECGSRWMMYGCEKNEGLASRWCIVLVIMIKLNGKGWLKGRAAD